MAVHPHSAPSPTAAQPLTRRVCARSHCLLQWASSKLSESHRAHRKRTGLFVERGTERTNQSTPRLPGNSHCSHPAMDYPETPAWDSMLSRADPDDNLAEPGRGRSSSSDDIEYPTGPRPTNLPAASQNVVFASATTATDMTVARGPSQKPRLERKGHTKSRRGCFHCKARRIKVTAGVLASLSRHAPDKHTAGC